MRAGRITISTRTFNMVDIAIPEPDQNCVRIKVGAAGVCLSDVHLLEGTLTPGYLQGDVVTIGHEVAGTIDKLGAGVANWKIGQRVIISAGELDEKGRVKTLGFDYDGGFAQYTCAAAASLVEIPDSLSFEEACIIPDAVSTPWAAITTTAAFKAGQSAAVFGIGGLGIHATALLRICDASQIIAIDPLESARERAIDVGATFALDPRDADFVAKIREATGGAGIDCAFDFAGVAGVRAAAFPILAFGGKLIIIGLAGVAISIPSDITFAYKRNQVLGHYGSELFHTQKLVSLIRAGKLDLSTSVTKVLPLEQAGQALDELAKKIGNPIRIVLKP